MAQITNAILLLSRCYLLSSAAGLQFKVGFTPDPDLAYNHRPDTDLLHTITCHQTHRVQYTWRDVMSASSKLGNTRNISESETFPIERKSPQSRLPAPVI